MREYEIGSEAWIRERVERGLDPGEADRPDDGHALGLDPARAWAEAAYLDWADSHPRSSTGR